MFWKLRIRKFGIRPDRRQVVVRRWGGNEKQRWTRHHTAPFRSSHTFHHFTILHKKYDDVSHTIQTTPSYCIILHTILLHHSTHRTLLPNLHTKYDNVSHTIQTTPSYYITYHTSAPFRSSHTLPFYTRCLSYTIQATPSCCTILIAHHLVWLHCENTYKRRHCTPKKVFTARAYNEV